MTDEHAQLHIDCAQFEREFIKFLEWVEYGAEKYREGLASSIAYIRMKAAEMVEHLVHLQQASDERNFERSRELLLDVKANMDFLSEEMAEVSEHMIRLINHVEEVLSRGV